MNLDNPCNSDTPPEGRSNALENYMRGMLETTNNADDENYDGDDEEEDTTENTDQHGVY